MMAGSVNRAILVGNVGNPPEIRYTQDGRPIANFSLATTDSWRDRNTGEKKERTEWHKVVVFSEGLCRVIESYVTKGTKLYIEGQLQTRKWEDQHGAGRYTTEIVLQNFGGTIEILAGFADPGNDRQASRGYQEDHKQSDFSSDFDSDIPF